MPGVPIADYPEENPTDGARVLGMNTLGATVTFPAAPVVVGVDDDGEPVKLGVYTGAVESCSRTDSTYRIIVVDSFTAVTTAVMYENVGTVAPFRNNPDSVVAEWALMDPQPTIHIEEGSPESGVTPGDTGDYRIALTGGELDSLYYCSDGAADDWGAPPHEFDFLENAPEDDPEGSPLGWGTGSILILPTTDEDNGAIYANAGSAAAPIWNQMSLLGYD